MSPGKSLIRMEGISGDAPMEKLPEKLHWEASGNTYANMVDMVEAIGPDSMVVRKSIGGLNGSPPPMKFPPVGLPRWIRPDRR